MVTRRHSILGVFDLIPFLFRHYAIATALGLQVNDQPQHRTLPLTVRRLEICQECEPEEATEANIDGSQTRRHQLEVDGCEECPYTDASLEEDNMGQM